MHFALEFLRDLAPYGFQTGDLDVKVQAIGEVGPFPE